LRSSRIFHTESFRLSALFAILFLGLAGLLMTATYWIVRQTQTAALVDAIDADISTIRNGFREEGLPEAEEIVRQLLGAPDYSRASAPGGYILLQDRTRGKIAGNLPAMPNRLGLVSMPGRRRHGELGAMLGRGEFLTADVYLFVARDAASMGTTRARILRAYALITGAALLLAILGGVFFSVQFLRRIDAITVTCNAIVAGRFHDRIALRGSDDELDRLGRAINSMLDRIAALLDNLRQMSSDVAHDLRTPLTHLRQRLENASRKSTTLDDYSAAVGHAIADADELLTMFSALLRISQIEAGSRLAAFSTVSLSDLLQRVTDMLRPVAEDHGQTLDCDLAPEVSVRGDAELLVQLFVNLVENSVRHTPPGSHIRIGLREDGGQAVATVADTGPGIAAGEHDKVFQRFYRGAASRTTPGNGLGLALVAAIANLHQAKVELADNVPGLRVSVSLAAQGAAATDPLR
jgi:signal transduction histidine kinase